MRGCWTLSSCLLLQAVLIGQAPEALSSGLWGPAAFDPLRGRIVRALGDRTTWEWDGVWFRSLATAPDIGSGTCDMVFDPVRRQLVMATVLRGPGGLFAYDGKQWTPLPMPSGQWPLHLVSDTARSRLVLLTVNSAQSFTSTFEDSGQGWVQVNTATRVPYQWLGPMDAATYDPLTARTMLVTGGGANGRAAVWSYDGANWSLQTAGAPPLQQGCALAFDPVRGVVVMHGGLTGFAFSTDVWEWNGTAWTNRGPGAGAALASFAPSLTFDSLRGRMLGVGGDDRDAYVAQWDGTAWTVLDRPAVPRRSQLAYDPLRDATVAVTTTMTREWRDGRWASVTLQQPSIEHAFFDLVRGAVVGVSLVQPPGFWTWDGTNWNALSPSPVLPPPRSRYVLSFDLLRGRATLFGGSTGNGFGSAVLGDTWEWNGTTWTQLLPSVSPPARYDAQMACDIAGARTVLISGKSMMDPNAPWLTDAWSWNGTTWQQLSAAEPWMSEGRVGLVYDDVGSRTLAVSFANGLFEVRTLGGSSWQLLRSTSAEAPAIGLGFAAFESRRGTVLLSGGGLARVPIHAAVVSTEGAGCGRPLQLSARTWPRAGENNFGFDVQGVLGAALVAVSVGTANTALGGGCTALLPSIDLASLVFANAAGFGEARVPIPDAPLFRGLAVHAQAAQLDPTSPIGVGLSARLDLVVGD